MPAIDQNANAMPQLSSASRLIGCAASTAAVVALFTASAVPIPLMTALRDALHLTNATATVTTAGYFRGCTGPLTLLPGISNRVGCRRATIGALLLAALSLELLLSARGFPMFFAARLIQGVAAGGAGLPSIGFLLGAPVTERFADAAGEEALTLIGHAAQGPILAAAPRSAAAD